MPSFSYKYSKMGAHAISFLFLLMQNCYPGPLHYTLLSILSTLHYSTLYFSHSVISVSCVCSSYIFSSSDILRYLFLAYSLFISFPSSGILRYFCLLLSFLLSFSYSDLLWYLIFPYSIFLCFFSGEL